MKRQHKTHGNETGRKIQKSPRNLRKARNNELRKKKEEQHKKDKILLSRLMGHYPKLMCAYRTAVHEFKNYVQRGKPMSRWGKLHLPLVIKEYLG